ncbi:radial spoke head protein 3 [Histomonas meleagridis]|uniref:radial spoke head protein 3-like n=1 Tax=Histomonas meleagridis TaxID=135588 RepID=UPI00355A4E6A|nr:radial spoke head protein 3 [Histomonas meleagridis]KAH0800986.1 radial spoke head protein 3-like [Histomonas meleagridis]
MSTPNYSYRADARPIQERPKYREQDEQNERKFRNITVDPRVYHGSTYEKRNRYTEQITRIPSTATKSRNKTASKTTEVPTREGFSDSFAQTDEFDGTVVIEKNEVSVSVQTDPYVEKPIIHQKPAPLRAVGVRTNVPSTELFNFDIQVRPIVATLVQKALSQAVMEFSEEEELANMRRYLKAYAQTDKKEKESIARIEAAEERKFQEKERILQERLKIEKAQHELRSKVSALGYAEFFIWDIEKDVMKHLNDNGYFYDENEKEIKDNFLVWLTDKIVEEIRKPPIEDEYIKCVMNNVMKLENQKMNEERINEKIGSDRNEINKLRSQRKMISEDFVAHKIREVKNSKKKKNENE